MNEPRDDVDRDRLAFMFALQHDVARKVDRDPLALVDPDERIQYVKDMTLALIAELHEMLNEIGWKPWATSNHINEAAAFGELRDAWQFLMNLMFAVTLKTPYELADELYVAHARKTVINVDRARNGYDGVAGKCPQCHRDLGEVEVKEVIATSTQRVDLHCPCGAYLGSRTV
jgi:dimeric dUTPase (all-alpha-NTP-PPase superfamily)